MIVRTIKKALTQGRVSLIRRRINRIYRLVYALISSFRQYEVARV